MDNTNDNLAANNEADNRPVKKPRTTKPGPPHGKKQPLDLSSMSPRKQQIMASFAAYRDTLDEHYDQRERIIKCSRDITALSKKMVFALLRITQDSPENVFADVEAKHKLVLELFEKLSKELAGSNATKYNRQATPGIQEYIEAVGLWRFLQHNELVTPEQVLAGLTPDNETMPMIPISDEDYLLGVCDLPGEVNRYCINSIGKGDRDAVHRSLEFLRALKEGVSLLLCTRRFRDVEKKMPVLESSLEKIEKAFYSMCIRESEMQNISTNHPVAVEMDTC